MRNVIFATVFCAQILLTGCVGVGIVATSDPLTKLNDAEYLFIRENRPLPAERLIFEALEIYQSQSDSLGLGHAHREYGDFLLSVSVSKWDKYYREHGFRDKSITYENRVAKSKEYFTKALEYYQTAERKLQESGQFNVLTNLNFNIAWAYYRLDDRTKSCEYYDKTILAYEENVRRNPSAKGLVPSDYKSFGSMIESKKVQVCGSQPQSEKISIQNAGAFARSKGCMTCHSASKKAVASSLRDIAKRRRSDPNAIVLLEYAILAERPRDPRLHEHPMANSVSLEEARMLATWILSLENPPSIE